MKKYQIDWVQFICALITVVSLVGAVVVAMFVFPRQPWPVTFPLLCVAALFSVIVDARMEEHGRRGRK